ncbi:MAG TPA: hypothetical protein VIG88_08315 [Lysobacter sp.]
MLDWLLDLPLLGQLWLAYAVAALALLGLAATLEFTRARHVDGAGGWMLFGALALSFWGLVLTGLATLAILLLRWLA